MILVFFFPFMESIALLARLTSEPHLNNEGEGSSRRDSRFLQAAEAGPRVISEVSTYAYLLSAWPARSRDEATSSADTYATRCEE